jgi:hypothetical protein
MKVKIIALAALALVMGLGMGCTTSESNPEFTLIPVAPATYVGTELPLSVHLTDEVATEPEWEVQEYYGGGFLKTHGFAVTYVPPTMPGTFHLLVSATLANGKAIHTVEEIQVLPLPARAAK